MAIVKNEYTGDGSQVLFTFSFPYIDESNVKVSIDGVVTTAWTFANSNTVQFNAAPSVGATILIYRQTEDSAITAQLVPGGPVPAEPLNENFTQTLYLTQESNDQAAVAEVKAESAITTATGAATDAASAVSAAAGATASAAQAVSTANGAATQAANAVTTANSANAAAATATSTANTALTAAQTAAADAASAVTTAGVANTAAQNAQTAATSAVNTATAASTTANNALSTANTASQTATNAAGQAATAVTDAAAAVVTANTASSTATTAQGQAAAAVTTANAAQTAANSANSNASTALTTANAANTLSQSAASQAASAVTTANQAATDAATAISTANTASGVATQAAVDASNADANSQVALVNAYAAIAAVANAVAYAPVADLTALGALTGMANDDPFELQDSTGVESSSLVTGVPAGFVGDSGLAVRLLYKTATSKFEFQNYFATDPENRYAEIATETAVVNAQASANLAQVDATQALSDAAAAQSTANTAVSNAAAAQSTANTALSTANAALPKTGGTMTGSITFAGAQTFPVAGIQDGTTTQKGVVQLENSAASTSTTTAAVPAAVKVAKDAADGAQSTANTAVANAATAQSTANQAVSDAAAAQSTANSASSAAAAAQSTANTANSTANSALSVANAAMPKSGGTFTGDIDIPSGSAGSPSLGFSSSTNSGLFLNGDGSSVSVTSNGIERARFGGNIDLYINQNNAQAVRINGYWSGSGGSDMQHWLVPGLRDWKLAIGGAGNWVLTDLTSNLGMFRINTNTVSNGSFALYRYRRTDITDSSPVRAALKYNGQANAIRWAQNISSVTKVGTGDYIVYFSILMGDPAIASGQGQEYAVVVTPPSNSATKRVIGPTLNTEQTDTSVRIQSFTLGGTISDSNMVNLMVIDD